MKVAIDAQILDGGFDGGVEHTIVGLIKALARESNPADEYIIVGTTGIEKWLKTFVSGNQRVVRGPRKKKGYLNPVRDQLRSVKGKIKEFAGEREVSIPDLRAFYNALGADILHIPHQRFVISDLPTIYNPLDLQHIRFPEFFEPAQIRWRETVYRFGCERAHTVAAPSQFSKLNIESHYQIPSSKVRAIPNGSQAELWKWGQVKPDHRIIAKRRLVQPFALFPAQSWPHKNHLRLIDAISLVKDKHQLRIDVVLTGRQNAFWREIKRRAAEVGVESQIHPQGYVSEAELRALYGAAQFLIFPSLFEGGGLPVLEAFAEGLPVACSNTTSLPEFAGDAALLFNPSSVPEISEALFRLSTDEALRGKLRTAGRLRAARYSWKSVARQYQSLYREILASKYERRPKSSSTDHTRKGFT